MLAIAALPIAGCWMTLTDNGVYGPVSGFGGDLEDGYGNGNGDAVGVGACLGLDVVSASMISELIELEIHLTIEPRQELASRV